MSLQHSSIRIERLTVYVLWMLGVSAVTLATDGEKRYDVPLVDLADREALQTVVDREPGQYLGHPTTVLLEEGRTVLCVYPKGHGNGAIVMKRSRDGGRTWSDRLPTPDNWATSREVPTIYRTVDPDTGAARLILFSGLYPIRMAVSETRGRDWTPLEPIGEFGGIVAMADVLRLKDGRYMALRLMDDHRGHDCAYPAIEVLPDGAFLATTYGHWAEGAAPYIVSLRFKLSQLDAMLEEQNEDG